MAVRHDTDAVGRPSLPPTLLYHFLIEGSGLVIQVKVLRGLRSLVSALGPQWEVGLPCFPSLQPWMYIQC